MLNTFNLYSICDVKWRDQDIIVMDKVVISSPYKPENCRPLSTGNGQQYEIAVKKLQKVVSITHTNSLYNISSISNIYISYDYIILIFIIVVAFTLKYRATFLAK